MPAAASPPYTRSPCDPRCWCCRTVQRRHRYNTGTTPVSPRCQRDFHRGDLRLHLLGWSVVVELCGHHPLKSSAVVAAAWGTGASAKPNIRCSGKNTAGTGACRYVPQSHGTEGRAGPPPAPLHELDGFVSWISRLKDLHGECDVRPIHDLSTTYPQPIHELSTNYPGPIYDAHWQPRHRTAGPRLGAFAADETVS